VSRARGKWRSNVWGHRQYQSTRSGCSALLAAAVTEDAVRKSPGHFLQATALVPYQSSGSLDW